MNAVTAISPAETFRAKASNLMKDTASMTLHELVDEFARLTGVMDENLDHDEDYPKLNQTGQLAERERKLVNGAIRCRFGLHMDSFDRASDQATGNMPW